MHYLNKVHKVSKLTAAKEQLIEAIILFFNERSPIAVHTLAGASAGIIEALAKQKDITGFLRDAPFIRPEKQNIAREYLNKAQNFFKHADRDPEEILDFPAEQPAFEILNAIYLYHQLTDEWPHEFRVFELWFAAKYPDCFIQSPATEVLGATDPDDFELWKKILLQRQS